MGIARRLIGSADLIVAVAQARNRLTDGRTATVVGMFANVHVACTWLGVDPELVLTTIDDLRNELRA